MEMWLAAKFYAWSVEVCFTNELSQSVSQLCMWEGVKASCISSAIYL